MSEHGGDGARGCEARAELTGHQHGQEREGERPELVHCPSDGQHLDLPGGASSLPCDEDAHLTPDVTNK